MRLSADDIRDIIGEPDFSRGQVYFRSGKVVTAGTTPEGLITGRVKGSGRRDYTQNIQLMWKGSFLENVDGHCTCPVGFNCKHVTAVLLTAYVAGETAPQLSPHIKNWLQSLNSTTVAVDKKPSTSPRHAILYVLGMHYGEFTIRTFKVTLDKTGIPRKSGSRYDNRLSAAIDQKPQFVTEEDLAIFSKLVIFGFDETYFRQLKPSGDDLNQLVDNILATARVRWGEVNGPDLSIGEGWQGRMIWSSEETGDMQRLGIVSNAGEPLVALPMQPLRAVNPKTGQLGPVRLNVPSELVQKLLSGPPIAPEETDAVARALSDIGAEVPLPARLTRKNIRNVKPSAVLHLLGEEGQVADYSGSSSYRYRSSKWYTEIIPILRLRFKYGDHETSSDNQANPKYREGDTIVTLIRDLEAEMQFDTRLQNLGILPVDFLDHIRVKRGKLKTGDLSFSEDDQFSFEYTGVEAISPLDFVNYAVPELRAEGWRIDIDDSWPFRLYEGPVDVHAKVKTDENNWFSFALTVTAGEHELDILPALLSIIRLLPVSPDGDLPEDFDLSDYCRDMSATLEMPDGSFVQIPLSTLQPLIEAFVAVHGLGEDFHPAEAKQLFEISEALAGSDIRFEGGDALRALGQKLKTLRDTPECEPPAAVVGELRPYQKAGFGWLSALQETGFGGILADDMGLGKTLQALALLAKCHLEEQSDRPSLLVVPTSLIGNWQREANRFTPALKLLVLHGADRHHKFPGIPQCHLVVTTYPLLHRDHASLFAYDYELAILDEAQAVKNPAAAVSKLIRKIPARQRIALTGTPLENNLEELWSLFDWLIPGLLGNRKKFQTDYRRPIEKQGDAAAQKRLSSRVAPFLMRRTKEAVAPELPDKTEITELVPLSPGQKALYEPLRLAMDKRVRQAIASKGFNSSRITILDALLKLRQVCCDPALVKLPDVKKDVESAKRTRLLDMLEPLMSEGRRVLIFSQFVQMLRLIEKDVTKKGWDYALLTGQTKDRTGQVDLFQSGAVSLFLISLKAGGTGLNLTAADTVILYDPWWNPAVERQAMDRAHRIGQDKNVFVYRLVAEGTVEQAIQSMQARKQALADALFEGTPDSPLSLTETDLADLFKAAK